MKFVYENISTFENFTSCTDVNRSGIKRFAISPFADMLGRRLSNIRLAISKWSFFRPKQYIIATGVNHSPWEWTGGSHSNGRDSLFEHLNPIYLKDLQEGRAMLLLDQSLEGNHTDWLWDWFYIECDKYKISPSAIVYVTGNLLAKEQYNKWIELSSYTTKLNIICYALFEQDVYQMAQDLGVHVSYTESLEYKTTNDIKLFNCLQKRLRPHRLWFYHSLLHNNLVDKGLVSQNKFSQAQTYLDGKYLNSNYVEFANNTLPSLIYGKNNNEHDDSFYIRRIVKDVYMDSWLSVVSEVAFGEQDHSIFISEKTFKAIACCHPFILLSAKGSLEKLRAMGYKTFHPYIDETYDTLDTFERFDAICNELKRIDAIKDKVSWFKQLESIIIHNKETLEKNTKAKFPAFTELETCYKNYFK